jgi:hypothetical protein
LNFQLLLKIGRSARSYFVIFIFIIWTLYIVSINQRINNMIEVIPIWIQDSVDTNQYYSLEDRLIILEEEVNKLKQK